MLVTHGGLLSAYHGLKASQFGLMFSLLATTITRFAKAGQVIVIFLKSSTRAVYSAAE
jgi:hypothetical protein